MKKVVDVFIIAIITVLLMVVGAGTVLMFSPDEHKTLNELYEMKRQNGVSLKGFNTERIQKEMELATINKNIAEINEVNAKIDVCINLLESGENATCNVETLSIERGITDVTSSGSGLDF